MMLVLRAACAILLALLAGVGAARAGDSIAGPIEVEVLRVIDGDTFAARAEVWPGAWIETGVRLAGLDTPELRGKCPAEREDPGSRSRSAGMTTDGRVRPGLPRVLPRLSAMPRIILIAVPNSG